jgi:hypothetical protein
MFSAFWVQYNDDRKKIDERNNVQDTKIEELTVITYNLAKGWEDTRDWKKEVDKRLTKHEEEFMEIWKSQKRNGHKIDPKLLEKPEL